jgi:hypothetical protein
MRRADSTDTSNRQGQPVTPSCCPFPGRQRAVTAPGSNLGSNQPMRARLATVAAGAVCLTTLLLGLTPPVVVRAIGCRGTSTDGGPSVFLGTILSSSTPGHPVFKVEDVWQGPALPATVDVTDGDGKIERAFTLSVYSVFIVHPETAGPPFMNEGCGTVPYTPENAALYGHTYHTLDSPSSWLRIMLVVGAGALSCVAFGLALVRQRRRAARS